METIWVFLDIYLEQKMFSLFEHRHWESGKGPQAARIISIDWFKGQNSPEHPMIFIGKSMVSR